MASYDFKEIEQRWQQTWADQGMYRVPNPGDEGFDPSKPKMYILDMFPYPSGAGLHVGHPLGYIGTDIFARYHRMRGANVLHPMAFDAFGLPAEQYAVETGRSPRVSPQTGTLRITRASSRRSGSHTIGIGPSQPLIPTTTSGPSGSS